MEFAVIGETGGWGAGQSSSANGLPFTWMFFELHPSFSSFMAIVSENRAYIVLSLKTEGGFSQWTAAVCKPNEFRNESGRDIDKCHQKIQPSIGVEVKNQLHNASCKDLSKCTARIFVVGVEWQSYVGKNFKKICEKQNVLYHTWYMFPGA